MVEAKGMLILVCDRHKDKHLCTASKFKLKDPKPLIDLYSCARSTGLSGSQSSRDYTRVKYCFQNENLVRNKLAFLERRVYSNNSNIREPTRNKRKFERRCPFYISGRKVFSHMSDRSRRRPHPARPTLPWTPSYARRTASSCTAADTTPISTCNSSK